MMTKNRTMYVIIMTKNINNVCNHDYKAYT